MNEAELQQLAVEIAERLPQPIPLSVKLWSAQNIADYLGVSKRQVMERIAPHPKFPAPIRLPSVEATRGNPRWKAIEVIAWTESYQERKAA